MKKQLLILLFALTAYTATLDFRARKAIRKEHLVSRSLNSARLVQSHVARSGSDDSSPRH